MLFGTKGTFLSNGISFRLTTLAEYSTPEYNMADSLQTGNVYANGRDRRVVKK